MKESERQLAVVREWLDNIEAAADELHIDASQKDLVGAHATVVEGIAIMRGMLQSVAATGAVPLLDLIYTTLNVGASVRRLGLHVRELAIEAREADAARGERIRRAWEEQADAARVGDPDRIAAEVQDLHARSPHLSWTDACRQVADAETRAGRRMVGKTVQRYAKKAGVQW